MVVAPDTDLAGAGDLAERLRRAVRDNVDIDGVPVTASVGYAVAGDDEPDAAEARADRALYRAKAAGRDCCVTLDGVRSPALV